MSSAATDAGRVIAGSARGMRLAPAGPGTRPLGDRLKQALFAMLEREVAERRVLDLFAGVGSGGIEALSRGAPGVVFVESDRMAAQTIRVNLARCRLEGSTAIVEAADVGTWLGRGATRVASDGTFGLVLVDPPYQRSDLLLAALEQLGAETAAAFLDPDAIVVAKSFWRDAPPPAIGLLASERTRRFGDTVLTIYRRMSPPGTEA